MKNKVDTLDQYRERQHAPLRPTRHAANAVVRGEETGWDVVKMVKLLKNRINTDGLSARTRRPDVPLNSFVSKSERARIKSKKARRRCGRSRARPSCGSCGRKTMAAHRVVRIRRGR